MADISAPWLMWIVGVPWLAALAFFPFTQMFGRRFAVVVSLLATSTTVVLLLSALRTIGDAGGWGKGDFVGARLTSEIFSIGLVADPLSVVVALGFSAAFLIGLMGAAFAWGGGPRRQPTKAGAGQLFALLFLLGVLQLATLAEGIHVVIATAPIASALGYGIMLAARPRRDGLEGASRVYTSQRVADAALLLGLGMLWISHRTFKPIEIARHLAESNAQALVERGPFAGMTTSTEWTVTAILLLSGCGLRLACFPWVSIGRNASGAPAPVAALISGTTSLGLPLLILLKSSPTLVAVPLVGTVAMVVVLVSASFHAAIGAASKRVLAVDMHLTSGLALVGAAMVLLGNPIGATLALVTTIVGAALMALPASAVIEAMQGQTDLHQLGGLQRALVWTKRGRWLALGLTTAAPFGTGLFLVINCIQSVATDGQGTFVVVSVLLFAALSSFAGFRSHFLQFGGADVRGERPARLVEAGKTRSLLPLVFGAAFLVGAALLLPPLRLWQMAADGEQAVLVTWLNPVVASTSAPIREVAALAAQALSPTLVVVFALAASLIGWGASSALYRQGPSPLLRQIERQSAIRQVGRLLGAGALFERVVDRVVTGPAMKGARFVVQTVLPTLIVAPPTRLPALPATAIGFVLRMIHNGDMQRGLLFLVASVAGLLWWWSLR